jgi:transcriptional regulator of acetoin/glycerol metabolism
VVLNSVGVLSESTVEVNDAKPAKNDSFFEGTLHDFTERAKAQRIRLALQEANGNHSLAAETLDINRATLYRLIQRLGV